LRFGVDFLRKRVRVLQAAPRLRQTRWLQAVCRWVDGVCRTSDSSMEVMRASCVRVLLVVPETDSCLCILCI
jgi:hypothetical protein